MLATNFKYDLILLDIMMPEMDGLEVLRRLREESPNKNTPIIMMTAYGDSASVKRQSISAPAISSSNRWSKSPSARKCWTP